MSGSKPIELIAKVRNRPSLTRMTHVAQLELLTTIATVLEAQLAEIARLQAVIEAGIKRAGELIDSADDINYEEDNFDAGQFYAADCISDILASASPSSAPESPSS